jgi:hypothetical protein
MAILAACLPTLRPLAIKFIPHFISGSSYQSSSKANGHVRQGSHNHTAWVSAKFSRTSGRTVTEAESIENLYEEPGYNLAHIPPHTIAVERDFTVKTSSAV